MPHKITDACSSCGVCEPECKQTAISQGATQYEIDPAKCTDCGDCVPVCPMEAIVKEEK